MAASKTAELVPDGTIDEPDIMSAWLDLPAWAQEAYRAALDAAIPAIYAIKVEGEWIHLRKRRGRPVWSGEIRSIEAAVGKFDRALSDLSIPSRPIPLHKHVATHFGYVDIDSGEPTTKYWRYRKLVGAHLAENASVGGDLIREFLGLPERNGNRREFVEAQ